MRSDRMFLPKPNAFTLPNGTAPEGIGIQACNSGNNCNNNACDVNKPSCGGDLGAGIGIGAAAGAVLAAL